MGCDMINVLVADDDRDIRDTVRIILEDAGYAVQEAENGLQALDCLRSTPDPLVVLLDVNMPGMTGLEVLEFVARCPPLCSRHTYIVITASSAKSLVQIQSSLSSALALAALGKPFDVDALLDTVAHAASRLA
ncbi:MAG: hypothetical protein OJF49_004652 [Ktedonobacterales bacterium]|jgi:CheY-like chemotaxis protein|nr:MAG: hypothetical protein OJF49_004652 [Ktedonobacterales bacterium]